MHTRGNFRWLLAAVLTFLAVLAVGAGQAASDNALVTAARDGDLPAVFCLEGQVVVPGIPVALKPLEHDDVRFKVLERAEFGHGVSDHLGARKPQERAQERVDVFDAASLDVEDQDAILGGFE